MSGFELSRPLLLGEFQKTPRASLGPYDRGLITELTLFPSAYQTTVC
jgi:hypothetical protein